MTHNLLLSNLIEANVFNVAGECVGSIDGLLIDPFTGIVKSVLLITGTQEAINLPWSAMCFDKSRQTFLLTPVGESVFERQSH